MMISSNTARGILRVRYTRAGSKGQVKLALLNNRGKVLEAPVRLVNFDTVTNAVEFAIQHDVPGLYYVKLSEGKSSFTQRVSLQ